MQGNIAGAHLTPAGPIPCNGHAYKCLAQISRPPIKKSKTQNICVVLFLNSNKASLCALQKSNALKKKKKLTKITLGIVNFWNRY